MQKISVEVLEKMVEKKVTSKEIDFLLYIARFQDDYGRIQGVYYRELMEEREMSHQAFYDCKKTLEEKGLISCQKLNYYDWDITIKNNSFKGKENFGRGYVSLHNDMIYSEEFRSMRAGAKLMALWLLREWKIYKSKTGSDSYQIGKDKLLEKFRVLGVTKRKIRSYLSELAPFLSVYLEGGKKYYITFKKRAVTRDMRAESENDEYRMHNISVSYRRNRIAEVPVHTTKEALGILKRHNKKIEQQLTFDFSMIIRKSLEIINQKVKDKHRWRREVSVPLIHKVLVQEFA